MAMAVAAASLSISIDPQLHLHFHHSHSRFLPKPISFLSKSRRRCFKSDDDDPFNWSNSIKTEEDPEPYPILRDPFGPDRFLNHDEYEMLKTLENFTYREELGSGSLQIRFMRPEEVDCAAKLIIESYAELWGLPVWFVEFLGISAELILTVRRADVPHAATLVGFHRGVAGEELAGTVEVIFDEKGATFLPLTPSTPKDKPYIANMAVKKGLRRKGIGWHLLKASEKLISEMTPSKEVYLHCRLTDAAPFNLYTKAGYRAVKTDSLEKLLMVERRKHLMRKNLSTTDDDPEPDISGSDEET